MGALGRDLLPLLKDATTELLGTEELVADAIRDLLKDEVKRHIMATLDADPALKEELRSALHAYLEAKAREMLAAARLAKSGVKLGVALMPPHLRDEVTKELRQIVEQELSKVFERSL